MTPEHKQNLETLRDYLRSGELRARFHMGDYASDERDNTCGTCGCAVGHGTLCIEPRNGREDWDDYCYRVFGITPCSPEWGWMFNGSWYSADNTPQGAAARIDWYLANGIPDDWYDQMLGAAPLCYATGATP